MGLAHIHRGQGKTPVGACRYEGLGGRRRRPPIWSSDRTEFNEQKAIPPLVVQFNGLARAGQYRREIWCGRAYRPRIPQSTVVLPAFKDSIVMRISVGLECFALHLIVSLRCGLRISRLDQLDDDNAANNEKDADGDRNIHGFTQPKYCNCGGDHYIQNLDSARARNRRKLKCLKETILGHAEKQSG